MQVLDNRGQPLHVGQRVHMVNNNSQPMHISAIYQGSSGRIQVFNPYHNEHATVHSSQVQAIPVHQDRLFTASETAASRAVAAADRVRMHLMHPPIAPDYHTRMQWLLDSQERAQAKAQHMQEILDVYTNSPMILPVQYHDSRRAEYYIQKDPI